MNIYKFYNKPKELIPWHPDDPENIGIIEHKKNGQYHQENKPAIEYPDGTKYWYLNGKRHREDGPAVEYPDGTKSWWINGKYHREDGPAVIEPNGTKFWYLHGQRYQEKEWKKKLKIILYKNY